MQTTHVLVRETLDGLEHALLVVVESTISIDIVSATDQDGGEVRLTTSEHTSVLEEITSTVLQSISGEIAAAELKDITAERDDLRDRVASAESALSRKGYRRSCDIPACNCGDSWAHGGYADTRLREILDAKEKE